MKESDLISRLDAATEGSRELDEAIATHLWGEPQPTGNVGHPRTLVWWHNGLGRSVAPEFTESVDMALTLVMASEGWHWVATDSAGANGDRAMGAIYRLMPHARHTVYAATPALALCIAALKAHFTTPQSPK